MMLSQVGRLDIGLAVDTQLGDEDAQQRLWPAQSRRLR